MSIVEKFDYLHGLDISHSDKRIIVLSLVEKGMCNCRKRYKPIKFSSKDLSLFYKKTFDFVRRS